MSNAIVSVVSVLVLALAAGCSGIPSSDERKAFLSEEQFSPGYKVAVTSVMKKPEVVSLVAAVMPLGGIQMLFKLGAFAAEPGASKTVGGMTPLERIDLAMKTSLEQHLPVSASFLDRSSFGGDVFVPQVSNVAFDAFQKAKAQGFDAMLFVHLQLALASVTGFGDRSLVLAGIPVFKSIRTTNLLYFETYRLECAEGKSIPEEQLPSAVSVCTDVLIQKMKSGLDAALAGRSTSAPAANK